MPVVNTTQARIELSAEQARTTAEIILSQIDKPGPPMVMIYVEETNLTNTVVVGGRGMPMMLVDHWGKVTQLGRPEPHQINKDKPRKPKV